MARSLGKPVVLVPNVPQSRMPGIGWLAAACDAVLDDGFGVQLARFNPVGVTLARPTEPLYAGDRDPREAPAVRALLDSLTGSAASSGGTAAAVRLTGARSWRGLPALYREHAVFVTASADQAREQLASGARVVGPLGSGVSAGLRPRPGRGGPRRPPARPRRDPRRTARHLRRARHARAAGRAGPGRGPPGEPGRRPAGRRARPGHRRRAGRAAGRRAAAPAPAARRGGRRDRRGRPGAGRARRAGRPRDPCRDHGRRLRRWPAPARTGRARWPGWPARRGWRRGRPMGADGAQPDTYLLDLACARECAQADAVGFGADEYEFTHWLDEPALARRGLLAPEGPAGRGLGQPWPAAFHRHPLIHGQGANPSVRITTHRAGLR